ncbi:uncharacterized protein LOC129892318 [Solanum dulcamara]|uniref:uncharacterized protein LOC129892318 n=1 Tax=Solanum dulcamara TaxID=45834 RepID=UPI002485B968|nr:uncharacterized protein LOC129892318 [Solanum dulcamara]
MANLLAVENWTWIDGCDDLNIFDVSQINGDIVMSLLDDMQDDQLDDSDDDRDNDERLTGVIKSLEAKIDQGQSRPTFNNVVSELVARVHGHDSFQDKQDFVESNDLDFSWMEMEMISSYPSDDMNLWCMDNNYGQDYEVIGGISNYSDTISFEENDYHSLWQEQNV